MASTALGKFPSLAVAYEVQLAELTLQNAPLNERITRVFQILDELIPNLGVYSKVMKIVKEELIDAVFCSQLTGSVNRSQANNAKTEVSVERITYCMLYKQLKSDKDVLYIEAINKLDAAQAELTEKNRHIISLNARIDKFQGEMDKVKETIDALNNEIAEKKMEIFRITKKVNAEKDEHAAKIEDLEDIIRNLKNNLKNSYKEVADLKIYKNAYDEIHASFEPPATDESVKPHTKEVMSQKNQILSDIINAKKLEEQILTLMNMATEEYDRFVEQYNARLSRECKNAKLNDNRSTRSSTTTNATNESRINDTEMKIMHEEIVLEKNNFKKVIHELRNEIDLIDQHRTSLEEKIYLIEQDRENAEQIRRSSTVTTPKSGLLAGLLQHYEPSRNGPDTNEFVPQERILSKWSSMLYTSLNGSFWKEIKEAKFCDSCGDRTFICPHKVTASETIIKLPPNTVYIKVVRPKLKFKQFPVKQAIEEFKKTQNNQMETDNFQDGKTCIVLTNYPVVYADLDEQSPAIRILNEGNSDAGLVRKFEEIWIDYNRRTGYKKKVSRPFTFERTLSIFENFLGYVQKRELNDDPPLSMLESLYEYFGLRYDIEEIQYSAVHDFFTSVYFYASKSKIIDVFCHVLIGNLDRCILNYLLYLADIIEQIKWKYTEDIKAFFEIIYPFTDDDDLDFLVLEYTSFTENTINKVLVWQFVMNLVLNRKDCLVNEMCFKLSTQQCKYPNMMTELEFNQAINEYFYLFDDKQTKIYFETSLRDTKIWNLDLEANCVPIEKLSHIASYYYLIQIIQELKFGLDEYIEKARERKKDMGFERSNQLTEPKGDFFKISSIEELANRIA